MKEPQQEVPYRLRKPMKEDGAAIWTLIKETKILDLNSAYSYLMLCEHFSETCVIAEDKNEVVGFVSAFRPPKQKDTIFVWQVAVHESTRGNGLGTKLLQELLNRDLCDDVHYLEATVSPSNIASQSLFKGLADKLQCPYEIKDCFSEKLFPEPGHEPEQTYRVGPF